MPIETLILEYLKVILTTPTVVALLGIAFLLLFKSELRGLISRVASVKFGGAELAAPQLPAAAERGVNEQLPKPEAPRLPEGIALSPQHLQILEQAFAAERARAYLWEYRYLNHFLVPATQRVLDWLASLPAPTTVGAYDTIWQPLVPSADQRRTMIAVLESHTLIVFQGDLIEVTPKGREYIQFRGPLAQLPPA